MLKRVMLALVLAALPAAGTPVAAAELRAQTEPFPIAEMMRATALDEVFTQFGPSIAASARIQEITADEIFLRHWEHTASDVFDAADLHRRLAQALEGRFSPDEQQALAGFFRAPFGTRVTALERESARLAPDAQLAAIAEGEALVAAAGAIRTAQLDELMQLVSAEISAQMVGQSIRAMLLGMSVSHQHGDIEVPWEEIDAQVEAMMPSLMADVATTQRAAMAYAYRGLSDAELDRYIAFLRTPPAQKFYALAAYAVGRIVADGMSAFGEAFAARMKSVDI